MPWLKALTVYQNAALLIRLPRGIHTKNPTEYPAVLVAVVAPPQLLVARRASVSSRAKVGSRK